eukprot:COSAG01_NODE_46691_length_397_cov_8.936242_1_plen_69_part_01
MDLVTIHLQVKLHRAGQEEVSWQPAPGRCGSVARCLVLRLHRTGQLPELSAHETLRMVRHPGGPQPQPH